MLPQTIFTAPRFASLANHVVGWEAQTVIDLLSLHVYFDYILLHQATGENPNITFTVRLKDNRVMDRRTVHQRYGCVLAPFVFNLALLQSWVFQNLQTALQICSVSPQILRE